MAFFLFVYPVSFNRRLKFIEKDWQTFSFR